jgi:hypothetical protein
VLLQKRPEYFNAKFSIATCRQPSERRSTRDEKLHGLTITAEILDLQIMGTASKILENFNAKILECTSAGNVTNRLTTPTYKASRLRRVV